MKKPRHPVSDHAVLRYLERVEGMDVEAVRRDIGRRIDAALAGAEGASGVTLGGFSYRIGESGIVSTVRRASRPERGRPKRRGPRVRDDD